VDTGHEVALKVLPARMAKNPIVLQRFLREARSAESLELPTSCRSSIEESIRAGITSSSSTCQGVTCMSTCKCAARSSVRG
jgi:hypothetical protein